MEKMEKEANVLSVEERLETEKQEKINEVIQNAKAEENDLHLEAMAAIPPEQMFDEIWEKLRKHGRGDKRERSLDLSEEIQLDDWTHVDDIKISQTHTKNNVQWEIDLIHVTYDRAYYKGDSSHTYDFYFRRLTDDDGNQTIEWRRNSDPGWLSLEQDLSEEDLAIVWELTDKIAFKKRQKPQESRLKRKIHKPHLFD